MVCMGSTAFDYSTQLGEALRRRGNPMDADEFLAVLQEASGAPAEALTEGEREFLLQNSDLDESDLTSEARASTQARVARNRAEAESAVVSSSLTTAEVAELLQRSTSNIRRSKASGDLYSPLRTPSQISGRTLLFPRWQFTSEGGVVPGLREIIPTFPRFYHPLSIERFMTAPNDDLDGRSPVQWLTAGGPVATVQQLVDELGFE